MNRFNKYPEIINVISSIEKLKQLQWPKFGEEQDIQSFIQEVDAIILENFEVFPNFMRIFEYEHFTLPIFRVRDLSSIQNIDLFNEHSYPPSYFVTFGRCNFPKNPVFYCSDNPMTALMEVIRNDDYANKRFCISKWKLLKTSDRIAFQTFLQTTLDERSEYNLLKEQEAARINEPFQNKLNQKQVDGLLAYTKFLHDTFINDSNYSISAYLAYKTLFSSSPLNANIIMYPSVQTKFTGVNMAIHPNFVDNRLEAQRFYIVELVNYNRKTFEFNLAVERYGYVDQSKIIWKDYNPDDQLYDQFFNDDFAHMLKK